MQRNKINSHGLVKMHSVEHPADKNKRMVPTFELSTHSVQEVFNDFIQLAISKALNILQTMFFSSGEPFKICIVGRVSSKKAIYPIVRDGAVLFIDSVQDFYQIAGKVEGNQIIFKGIKNEVEFFIINCSLELTISEMSTYLYEKLSSHFILV